MARRRPNSISDGGVAYSTYTLKSRAYLNKLLIIVFQSWASAMLLSMPS